MGVHLGESADGEAINLCGALVAYDLKSDVEDE